MATHRFHYALLGVALLLATGLTGCSSSQTVWDEYNPHPEQREFPNPRPLATDSQRLCKTIEQASYDPETLPWYAARNDHRLATYAGHQTPTYEQSATLTYDRQSSSNGRVYDHFNSTTYRSSVRETVR
ncbi:MAG: hypothetical protein K8S99_09255 [Planctomycetes bacterium]|nr:hypothetical protein [Planctomycetota bacterium]